MIDKPPDTTPRRYWWQYWKTPVLFGTGFCVLQVLIGVWRFRAMRDPVSLWLAIPSMLPGLLLFFASGLLVGLGVRRILKGVVGPWRIVLLMAFAAATPLAVWFSLVGGLLGPHGGGHRRYRSIPVHSGTASLDPEILAAGPRPSWLTTQ